MSETTRAGKCCAKRGFTPIELLVVSLLLLSRRRSFLVFSAARERAQVVVPVQREADRHGDARYVQDYDERFPCYASGSAMVDPWVFWPHQLQAYIKNWMVHSAPQQPIPRERLPLRRHDLSDPAQLLLLLCEPALQQSSVTLAQIERPREKYLCFDSNHPALGDTRGDDGGAVQLQWTARANVSETHQWLLPHMDGSTIGFYRLPREVGGWRRHPTRTSTGS